MNIINKVINELTDINIKIDELQSERNTFQSFCSDHAETIRCMAINNKELKQSNSELTDDLFRFDDMVNKRDITISRLKQENERYIGRIQELTHNRSNQDRRIAILNKENINFRIDKLTNRTK